MIYFRFESEIFERKIINWTFLSAFQCLSPSFYLFFLYITISVSFFPSPGFSFISFCFSFSPFLCHCPFYRPLLNFYSFSLWLSPSLTFSLSGLSHSHFALIRRIKISHPTLCPPLHMMIQNYHVLKLPTDKLYFKLSSAVPPSILLIRIPSWKWNLV